MPDDVIDRIVEASSFKFMKENKSTNPDIAYEMIIDNTKNETFMRKGMSRYFKKKISPTQLVQVRFKESILTKSEN